MTHCRHEDWVQTGELAWDAAWCPDCGALCWDPTEKPPQWTLPAKPLAVTRNVRIGQFVDALCIHDEYIHVHCNECANEA